MLDLLISIVQQIVAYVWAILCNIAKVIEDSIIEINCFY